MTQEAIELRTTGDTYPGLSVIQDINKALMTIATDFAGPVDPAAKAFPYCTWADTGNMLLKRRNAANTAWVVEGYLFTDPSAYSKMIGEIFYLRDDLAGASAPVTDNPNFRFIKLTAADPYNSGVLTSESVSGSAPTITATAVISLAGSPLNGRPVNLLNTEGRFLRASTTSGALQNSQNLSHGHNVDKTQIIEFAIATGTGGFALPLHVAGMSQLTTLQDGGNEARSRNQGATAYMRIK